MNFADELLKLIVSMTGISDDKIREFLSMFHGDVSEARAALSQYDQKRTVTTPVIQHYQLGDEKIISVQNISKHYKLGKQTVYALRDVTLSVKKGEFVAVVGASGSGKSTLLQMIGCLDRPDSGVIAIGGKQTAKLGDNALSELRQTSIGFIFQSFYLQPFLRVSDNLAVPAMFTNEKKQAIDSKVTQLLQQVGLSERSRHFPKELSGGQIQRAAIARALVNNPRIILADEPTGNLDSTNSKSIIDLFRTIRDKLGTTVVVVTHDMEIARQADRIIELKDGVVV
jgi:ABC-type lipoprotein export system ATPase subunit